MIVIIVMAQENVRGVMVQEFGLEIPVRIVVEMVSVLIVKVQEKQSVLVIFF